MRTYFRRSAGVSAFAAACVLGVGAFGFAANRAVPAPGAGTGSGAISGYEVRSVAYTSSGEQLTGVTFELGARAARVNVRLDSTGGSWYECGASAVTSPFAVNCAVNVLVADADSLSVVAAQ